MAPSLLPDVPRTRKNANDKRLCMKMSRFVYLHHPPLLFLDSGRQGLVSLMEGRSLAAATYLLLLLLLLLKAAPFSWDVTLR